MILAESNKYIVYNDYETVFLKKKSDCSEIIIGDFYGDPFGAFIDKEERFVVMYGCGVIIYYLPAYREYQYNMKISQWDEFGRKNPVIWVENVIQADKNKIILKLEDGKIQTIKIKTDIHF